MDFYLTTTYYTGDFPQINLQNLKPVAPALKDSTLRFTIPRTQFNIVNIDTIPVTVRQPVVVQPVVKSAPKPIISYDDSLKFNLIGKKESYTNWNLSPEYNPESFNQSLFSEINEQLLHVFDINADSLNNISSIQSNISSTQNETTEYSESKASKTIKNTLQGDNIFLSLIFISVMVTGFVRLNWKEYMGNILRSIFFQGVVDKISGTNASYIFPNLILSFLFFFNSSIFIYEVFKLTEFTPVNIDSLLMMPVIFGSLLVLFYGKIFILRFIGHIFDTQTHFKSYLRGFSFGAQAFAIIILPVIIIIPFINQSLQLIFIDIGYVIFTILYLLQISHGIKIILKETFSLYYIILYLCALEILPLSILFKVIFK